jgi:hypothetical protein
VYYSRGAERAENGVAIVMSKSIMKFVVKKILFNEKIIALKLKVERVTILLAPMYMPKSQYDDRRSGRTAGYKKILRG